MTSHHVTCHVTWCHVPLYRPKEKEKEREKKINIKSEK